MTFCLAGTALRFDSERDRGTLQPDWREQRGETNCHGLSTQVLYLTLLHNLVCYAGLLLAVNLDTVKTCVNRWACDLLVNYMKNRKANS